MINISLTEEKRASCLNCSKERDKYRKIYSVCIGDTRAIKFNLCKECMDILTSKALDAFHDEFDNNNETKYDLEKSIEAKLRILLNKKISGGWNDDCQRELESLDQDSMCNSHRLIYRQICDW